MKKSLLFITLLLFLLPCTVSFALTNANDLQEAITKASTDDLVMLRELIDAELNRRFEAIGLAQKTEINYVLNTNSKKFHIPSCESVNHMKEKNKKEFKGDREELISLGYKPCGTCHP